MPIKIEYKSNYKVFNQFLSSIKIMNWIIDFHKFGFLFWFYKNSIYIYKGFDPGFKKIYILMVCIVGILCRIKENIPRFYVQRLKRQLND